MTPVGVLVGVLLSNSSKNMIDYSGVNRGLTPIAWDKSCGTPGGIRTPDPRFRRPMLYPLSYGRISVHRNKKT